MPKAVLMSTALKRSSTSTMVMSHLPFPAGDSARQNTMKETHDGAEELLNTSNDEQSTISHFPSDLLSLIFQHAYPTPPFDGRYHCPDTDVLRSLSLVSKHWHRTLMDTPELWTSICIPMEGNDTSPYAAGLASFFGKTSHRSLSLSLDFSGLVNLDDSILVHPSLDGTILRNLERIENLQLVTPPRAWFSHLHYLKRTDHLSLYLIQGDAPHLPLDCMALLSKFTLVNGDIRLPVASSCLVTSLTLIGVPLNTCFNIIAHCPKLTKLHLEDYNSFGQQRMDGELPVKAFEPRQLEILVWKVFSMGSFVAPWQTALLDHIGASSLQTLVWHQPWSWNLRQSPEGQQLRVAIYYFFQRLSTTLTCLEFAEDHEDVWGNESLFIEQLHNDRGIESLKFSECNVPFIMAILEKLASPARFPRLRVITMGRIIWSNPRQPRLDERFEKMLSERFLKTLEDRWKAKDGQGLALYLEDDSLYRKEDGSNRGWLDHIKSEMVELKKGRGYQINIFVASNPVDWL